MRQCGLLALLLVSSCSFFQPKVSRTSPLDRLLLAGRGERPTDPVLAALFDAIQKRLRYPDSLTMWDRHAKISKIKENSFSVVSFLWCEGDHPFGVKMTGKRYIDCSATITVHGSKYIVTELHTQDHMVGKMRFRIWKDQPLSKVGVTLAVLKANGFRLENENSLWPKSGKIRWSATLKKPLSNQDYELAVLLWCSGSPENESARLVKASGGIFYSKLGDERSKHRYRRNVPKHPRLDASEDEWDEYNRIVATYSYGEHIRLIKQSRAAEQELNFLVNTITGGAVIAKDFWQVLEKMAEEHSPTRTGGILRRILRKYVVVTSLPSEALKGFSLIEGDIIESCNGTAVDSLDSLDASVQTSINKGLPLNLVVLRGGRRMPVKLVSMPAEMKCSSASVEVHYGASTLIEYREN